VGGNGSSGGGGVGDGCGGTMLVVVVW